MRRATTSLPQLSAAASATETAATMVYRTSYRGGRYQGRIGFSSDRSFSGETGQFIRADSHYRSVHDSNSGFRQGERGSFSNNGELHAPFQNPGYRENYQFQQGPPYYSQRPQYQQPRYPIQNRPPPSFRPRYSKPADYRNWEYAKTPPPSSCERFTVLSYNILADYLAIDHQRNLYYHIPQYMLDWEWRKKKITFELGLWSADIMCFQEVDKFHDLEEALKVRGYCGTWKMRTGIAVDGCAIFWRVSRFKLLHEESIEFNALGLRDNVAQICVLERNQNQNQNNEDKSLAPQTSSPSLNKVVICNIHVLYNPKRGEIKLGQVRILLEKAHAVSRIWNDAPIVLCGDFNSTPKSALYNFISEQKLDLSRQDRDKISGQFSAELRSPPTRYFNSRTQPAVNSTPFAVRPDAGAIDGKMDNSSNMLMRDCSENTGNENLKLENNSSDLDGSDSSFHLSNKSSNDLQLRSKTVTFHSEANEKSQHVTETTICISDESSITFTEDKNVSQLGPPLITNPGEFHLVATETTQMEKVGTTSHLDLISSTDDLDMNVNFGKDLHTDSIASEKFTPSGHIGDSCKVVDFSHSTVEYEKTSAGRSKCGSSWSSTGIDLAVDDKLVHLTSDEDGAMVDGGLIEDDSKFLSALHNVEDPLPSEFEQSVSLLGGSDQSRKLNSDSPRLVPGHIEVKDNLSPISNTEPLGYENNYHDRSLWTAMDIEIATGNADCTLMEHPLKLKSTYTEVEDISGTRDLHGEPQVTSHHKCFLGTVDYIWRSEGLQTVKVLAPIPKRVMQLTGGFPTKKWGSDHIALATEFAFVQTATNDELGS